MEPLKEYFSATRKVTTEHEKKELIVNGHLPEELSGTLFRNGNGRFEHMGVKYNHLFDGDGMVTKFEFKSGKIYYSNRYVQTKEFQAENRAGKMLYRSFGTNIPGGPWKNLLKMRFKNAANTSLVKHGGQLLALWEGGLPHRIDPSDLGTIDRYDYDGVLQNDFSYLDHLINPELPFSAHPKIHPQTGVLHNFGTAAGVRQRLLLYEVSSEGQARISQAIPMPSVTFTHDFVLTHSGKKIFFLTPVSFDLFRAFSGMESPVESMRVDRTQKTQIIVVGKDQQVKTLETDFCFVFHFANGYDVNDHKIVVDGYILEDFPSADMVRAFLDGDPIEGPSPMLTRFELDLQNDRVKKEMLSKYPGELPFVAPDRKGLPYRYVWNIAGKPETKYQILSGLAKVDTQDSATLFKDFWPSLPGEPIFVPRKEARAEDDGWLLMLLFDSEALKTKLLILDASNFSQIASADLPHNIPLGFHGFWTNEQF